MRKFLSIIVLFAVACCVQVRAGDDMDNVMFWFLQDPEITEIGGSSTVSIADLTGRGEADGLKANAVRVTARSGDVFHWLQVVNEGESGGEWRQSLVIPDGEGDYYAGPAYANLVGLDLGDANLVFTIEIGNYTGGNWYTLAVSESWNVAQLKEGDHIRSAQMDQYGWHYWTGGSYSVPEPSSGLLILIGAGLLALRRRRRAA